jgi:hypothetical protein
MTIVIIGGDDRVRPRRKEASAACVLLEALEGVGGA